MHTPFQRYQRIRTTALSVGMVLGMAATTLAPHAVHATVTKKSAKPTLAEKITHLPEATAEQLQAAERVLTGRYDCEFGKRVSIDPHTANKGYFTLKLGKQSWTMKPVLSNTGAVRLEDVKGVALMIQILTKSMLMDRHRGQRMVDGCVHDVQRAAEADLATRPRESLLGSPTPGN